MIVLPENPVAIQLYTVREKANKDFAGTLRELAAGGARAVEFAGYGGLPIPELRALLDELGMRVCGAHIPLAAFENDLDQALADLVALGGQYAIVPWLAEDRRAGVENARGLAASFNDWAVAAREVGLGFAYHHHDFEFNKLADGDGDTLFDILIRETDSNLVGFEVDVYWAARGGVDPAHFLRELTGRVPLVHLKDLGPAPDYLPIPAGEGDLRWEEILPAATAAGATWWVIEQDFPSDPIAEALLAVRNMEGKGQG